MFRGMSTNERSEVVETIMATLGKLPTRELRVLERIAVRLCTGHMAYGPLTRGKKEWRKEAAEEAFDMAVYLSCALMPDELE